MPVEIGEKAPEFTLFDSQKNEVSLSDFRGRNVILLFYPLAFTEVCTEELCGMRDALHYYNDFDTDVLAISVDTAFSLEKYRQEQSYNFPLLSDYNKEVSTDYDVLYEVFALGMRGVSKRAVFLIDREGITRHKEVLENAMELPDFNKLQTELKIINSI
ncbi:MAG: redoxin domain-containing protein [Chitinophagales bacterium]|nr:redoxin domain-containing protein [Chitinophagales bacterium]